MERVLWRLRNPTTNVVACCKLEEDATGGYALTVLWNRAVTTDHSAALWEATAKADSLRESFTSRG